MSPDIEALLAEFTVRVRWREDLSDAPRDGTEIEMRFREGLVQRARFSPPGTAPNVWRFSNGSALRSTDETGWKWRYPA